MLSYLTSRLLFEVLHFINRLSFLSAVLLSYIIMDSWGCAFIKCKIHNPAF